MSVAEKLIEVANKIPLVYSAGEAKHTSRYAVAFVVGDGTKNISFDCPFEPDYIAVQYHGAEASSAVYSVTGMYFDRRAFAFHGGFYTVRKNSQNLIGPVGSETGGDYFKWENGICTVIAPLYTYIKGCQYICTAVKYTDTYTNDEELHKVLKALLVEELSRLEPTGDTLYYSKARVTSVMKIEDFEALIPEGRTYGWEIPK